MRAPQKHTVEKMATLKIDDLRLSIDALITIITDLTGRSAEGTLRGDPSVIFEAVRAKSAKLEINGSEIEIVVTERTSERTATFYVSDKLPLSLF